LEVVLSKGKEVQLPAGPKVMPGANPAAPYAVAYQRALEQRRHTPKVAGGEGPHVPRLDSTPVAGKTLAEQGAFQQQRGRSIIEDMAPQPAPMPQPMFGRSGPSPLGVQGLLPNDLLADAAMADPKFMRGQGERLALNQPELAAKYGIVRNGQYVAPQIVQSMMNPNAKKKEGGISQATMQDLQTLANLQKKVDENVDARSDETTERSSAEGPAGPAARLAEEDAPKKDASKILDDFDFDTLRQLVQKDILNSPEQRKIIEGRLPKLSLGELVVNGKLSQVVPVVPGEFEPEFQTLGGDDHLAVKRLLMLEAQKLSAPDAYYLDKQSMMTITLGVKSINKRQLPSYRNERGEFDDDKFWEKFNLVVRFPMHMLASLGINFFWFDARVRGLFAAKEIKNS
jgi:hypothetical protein